jgi:hypothetical protein
MFEHKTLDGKWNRVVSACEPFVKDEVLECRDSLGGDADGASRNQFGVIGDLLVERCLPPQANGDFWSYDAGGLPWWGVVNNPPHAGLVADFNTHLGGLYRKPLDLAHNVVAFAAEGEEILFADGNYKVVRKSDEQELSATSILELRKLYFA